MCRGGLKEQRLDQWVIVIDAKETFVPGWREPGEASVCCEVRLKVEASARCEEPLFAEALP